ncbi:hypothetical protein MMAD_18150 [Mycolicibacterium madagascariense]|uniref:ABM domain-containing protein n=1 Tax=Mycolicibacterium madagascariense TaxID=212765 RepID=A0A7I7XDU5_9MYCO|nr:hypothetical protein [Mycolicibacterium madagascariense]MCV7015227.1 hypothetical protein [Mycolicibacterium madagascariense]BBZ27520.1 hypothetical protein MMAD_18150 [Mycolicibacterium madagascariense]
MIIGDVDRLQILTTYDVLVDDQESLVTSLAAHAEDHLATLRGFAGVAWLAQLPGPGQSESSAAAGVVQILQWDDPEAARNVLADPGSLSPQAGLQGFSSTISAACSELYRLDAVISEDGRDRAVLEVQPTGTQVATAIIVTEPAPGKRGWLAEYHHSETSDHIRHLPGFVSASFFAAEDSQRLAEIVQWRSFGHFSAAFHDHRFKEHVDVAAITRRPR